MCQKRPTIQAKETYYRTWLKENTPPPQREGIGMFVRSSERIQPTAHISSLQSYLCMYRYRCRCRYRVVTHVDIGLSGAPRGYSRPPTYCPCCHTYACTYRCIPVNIGIYLYLQHVVFPVIGLRYVPIFTGMHRYLQHIVFPVIGLFCRYPRSRTELVQ